MNPKYITIHETDNYNVGANARNHAIYLYNQATERKIVQRRGTLR